MDTPGDRKLARSACLFELESAKDVSRGPENLSKNKRNNTDEAERQAKTSFDQVMSE